MSIKKADGITVWLSILCIMVILVTVIGGITRLTVSGLSIVDWRPVTGVIPPMSEPEWQAEFVKYQQTPQFHKLNAEMELDGFKRIFFWEYLHRLLARSIGIVFLIPWLWFSIRKKVPSNMRLGLWGLLAVGAFQGFLGWFMVKSGLTDRPYVSHFRLAAHLSVALFLYSSAIWLIHRNLIGNRIQSVPASIKNLLNFLLVLVVLQIIYGAFTAGLHAGYGYNTFPHMGEYLVAPDILLLTPGWKNFFSNTIMIQFIHRSIGWMIFITGIWLWLKTKKQDIPLRVRQASSWLLFSILLQFALGVSTLVLEVPLPLAAAHQAGIFILLFFLVRLKYLSKAA